MTMRILSYPFRVAGDRIASVDQTSDEANAEQLAVLILTRPGERSMAQSYGVPDPAFGVLTAGDVAAAVAIFGPPVTIESIDVTYPTPTTEEVTVGFA